MQTSLDARIKSGHDKRESTIDGLVLMTNQTLIARAKAYVEASNAHDLDRVDAMFAENAEYESTGVGSHVGRGSIHAMMDRFFTAYPDVRWAAEAYRLTGDDGVAFDFVMTAKPAEGGDSIERRGVEQLFFTPDGLIRRIEVEA